MYFFQMCFSFSFNRGQGVRPIARGRGRTAAGSRSAGGRAYVLNGFLPQLHPILQASMNAGSGPNMTQVIHLFLYTLYYF